MADTFRDCGMGGHCPPLPQGKRTKLELCVQKLVVTLVIREAKPFGFCKSSASCSLPVPDFVPYKTHRQKLLASDPNGRLASYNSLIFPRHFQNPGRITVWVTRLVVEGV